MTAFNETLAAYRRLKDLRAKGQLTGEEFIAAAGSLGVTDDDGTAWVIGVESGMWYRATPEGWERAEPLTTAAAPPPPPPPEPLPATTPTTRRLLHTGPILLTLAVLVVGGLLTAAVIRGGDAPDPTAGDPGVSTTTLDAGMTPTTTAEAAAATPAPTSISTTPYLGETAEEMAAAGEHLVALDIEQDPNQPCTYDPMPAPQRRVFTFSPDGTLVIDSPYDEDYWTLSGRWNRAGDGVFVRTIEWQDGDIDEHELTFTAAGFTVDMEAIPDGATEPNCWFTHRYTWADDGAATAVAVDPTPNPESRHTDPVVWELAFNVRTREPGDAWLVFDPTPEARSSGATVLGADAVRLAVDDTIFGGEVADGRAVIIELVAALTDPETVVILWCHRDAPNGGIVARLSSHGWQLLVLDTEELLIEGDLPTNVAAGEPGHFRLTCTEDEAAFTDDLGAHYSAPLPAETGAGTGAELAVIPPLIEGTPRSGEIVLLQYKVYVAKPDLDRARLMDRQYSGGLGIEVERVRWVEEAAEPTIGLFIRAHAAGGSTTTDDLTFFLNPANGDPVGAIPGGSFPLGVEIPSGQARTGELWFPASQVDPGDAMVLYAQPSMPDALVMVFDLTSP